VRYVGAYLQFYILYILNLLETKIDGISILLLELVDLGNSCGEGGLLLLGLVLVHGGGSAIEEAELVLLSLLSGGSTESTSEDILVLLLWEVHVIVSVWVRVFGWIISIILPGGGGSQVLWMAIAPVLALEVSHRSTLIIVANFHCSLIGLVIDGFSSQVPLSLLSQGLEDMIWANLHNRDLLIDTGVTVLSSARLILSNLSVATSWNEVWLESHELSLLHGWVTVATILVTEGLRLSIWVPIIVSLVMSMILIE